MFTKIPPVDIVLNIIISYDFPLHCRVLIIRHYYCLSLILLDINLLTAVVLNEKKK